MDAERLSLKFISITGQVPDDVPDLMAAKKRCSAAEVAASSARTHGEPGPAQFETSSEGEE